VAATNISKTDLQLTADAIGAHGVFFKKALRALLETIPGARILGEEYPVEGTAVDLLIEYKAPTILFVLPIECKRALASQKRSIFFRDSARSVKFAYTFSGAELNFSPLTTTGPGFANICVEGVEIDLLQLQKSPYSAASADRIYKAALQACKGGLGFVRSEFKARKKYPAGPHQDFSSFLLMVTTAPLSIAELPVGSVDLITGKHVGDLKLVDVPWLVLHFPLAPLTSSEHLEVAPSEYTDPIRRGLYAKEAIVIVNAQHVSAFFSNLCA